MRRRGCLESQKLSEPLLFLYNRATIRGQIMNKKTMKVIGISAIITLGLGVYNAFFGNPFSKVLATTTATHYLEATYPEEDFTVNVQAYDFKQGGYQFEIAMADEKHPIVIGGFWGNKVKRDDIYTARLDEPMMTKLSAEASQQMANWLSAMPIKHIETYLEVSKGAHEPHATWSVDFEPNHPLVAFITLDAKAMTAEQFTQFAEDAKAQMAKQKLSYEYISLTAEVIKKGEEPHVVYATGFSPIDKKIKVKTFES